MLDGSEVINDNFPFETGNQIWGAVAADDMDGDGLTDIAVVSKSKHFYLLDQNGLKVDFDAGGYLLGTPAIGNLDGDADLEVVFSGYSSGNMIWALNADGSAVAGFPLDLGEKVKIGVALADFDGNGRDEKSGNQNPVLGHLGPGNTFHSPERSVDKYNSHADNYANVDVHF